MSNVIRIFVEKKSGFDVEAQHIKADLKGNLGMGAIEDLRLLHRYDVSGLSKRNSRRPAPRFFQNPMWMMYMERILYFPKATKYSLWNICLGNTTSEQIPQPSVFSF